MARLTCEDCGATVSARLARQGGTPRHAEDCASLPANRNRDAILQAHGANGSISAVASEDEIVDAVRRGALGFSEAMNRDF